MKKLFTMTTAFFLLFVMTLPTRAALVTITFDEPGIEYHEIITDQYNSGAMDWGVTFSSIDGDGNPTDYITVKTPVDLSNLGSDESDGQFIHIDYKPASLLMLLDTPADYLSFEFRRPKTEQKIFLSIYDTSGGTLFKVVDSLLIGWFPTDTASGGDDWWTYIYGDDTSETLSFDLISVSCSNKFLMDNIRVGTIDAVPIPTSVLLLGTGLIPLVLRRKKRGQAS